MSNLVIAVEFKDFLVGLLEGMNEASEKLHGMFDKFTREESTMELKGIKFPWIPTWYCIRSAELNLKGFLFPLNKNPDSDGDLFMYCPSNTLTANLYGFKDQEGYLWLKFLKVPLIENKTSRCLSVEKNFWKG